MVTVQDGRVRRAVGVVTTADDLATEAEDFQDYVIVHELLHLRYRDHGKQFKLTMTALVPNWRDLGQAIGTPPNDRRSGR